MKYLKHVIRIFRSRYLVRSYTNRDSQFKRTPGKPDPFGSESTLHQISSADLFCTNASFYNAAESSAFRVKPEAKLTGETGRGLGSFTKAGPFHTSGRHPRALARGGEVVTKTIITWIRFSHASIVLFF